MSGAPRWAAAVGVVAGVLLLHGLVLSGWPAPAQQPVRPMAGTAPLQVRTVPTMPRPSLSAAPAPPAAPGQTPGPAEAAVPAAAPPPSAATAVRADAPVQAQARAPSPAVDIARPPSDASTTTGDAPAAASLGSPLAPSDASTSTVTAAVRSPAERAGEPAPAGIVPPLYPTRPPPPFEWHYQVQRGASTGSAMLRWAQDGTAFGAALSAEVAGRPVLDWTSRGRIDAHGLAPDRFAVRREGREAHAANFQRDKRLITYAGPATQWPLSEGAQDRLSWMLQLAAIVDADPQRQLPGAEVVLFVTGARGDAAVWRFEVAGVEPVELAGGVRPALRLTRLADGPRPVQATLWLDPQRQHRPVQAVLTVADGGEPLQLRLQPLPAN